MGQHYLKAAMAKAKYEQLEDGTYYAEIEGFEGLWACEPTEPLCQRTLKNALIDWLVFRLSQGLDIPLFCEVNQCNG